MKLIEKTPDRIWISSEGPVWAKALCWGLSLATLLLLYKANNAATALIAIIGTIFLFVAPTSVAETIFDTTNDKIYGRYRIAGINFRNFEASIRTSKVVSTWGRYNPNLYLLLASGTKYRIGDFFTINEHEAFISKLVKLTRIEHERNF
jgi:hypothetical protein